MQKRPTAAWRDALAQQMALWQWERSEMGVRWLSEHYEVTMRDMPAGTKKMIVGLYENESRKLFGADPIYVSREMCEVVRAAQETFQPEALLLTDLVSDAAFVYFAQPFEVRDRDELQTTIAAASWGPLISLRPDETETSLSHEAMLERWRQQAIEQGERFKNDAARYVDGIALTIYANTKPKPWDERLQGRRPALVPIHFTPWWFGMTFEGNEWDEIGRPTGAAWWWRIVQTTMRLMQQRIAVRHEEHPDRALRREGARLRFLERKVLVVHLRRERSQEHEPSGESANYSHRFIVGAHWRNQWYPSLNAHRQIWIGDFVKGPLDKPLVIKPRRAFSWDR